MKPLLSTLSPRAKSFGPFLCHLGHTIINFGKWNGSFRWGLNWTFINLMSLLACIGKKNTHSVILVQTDTLEYRYLQYLANTQLTHLQRIRTFTTRRLAYTNNPTPKQQSAFSRSFSFLNYAMLEASATQSFADGLFSVCARFYARFASLMGHTSLILLCLVVLVPYPLGPTPNEREQPTLQHSNTTLCSSYAPVLTLVSPRGSILSRLPFHNVIRYGRNPGLCCFWRDF